MYPTAEVRWFYRGELPSDTEDWFRRRAGEVERQPPRTDHYLRLQDSEGLNVKLRGGRIEIKQRVGLAKVTQFHEGVTGALEQWRKWGFRLAEPGPARMRTLASVAAWIAVRKERRLRTYWVQDDWSIVAVPAAESQPQGCELELTEVDADGQSWWTLAFEAFGDESTLGDRLLRVARHVFRADEPPSLQAKDSHGYAAWLTNLARSEAPR